MSSTPSTLQELLEPIERLALAYAPSVARPAWEALLIFQHRLADTARPGREALMIQLRLSWWRDRLAEPPECWPKGEPLLEKLTVWKPETAVLIGLVDGWEAKVVGEDGGGALASAQILAYQALGRLVGEANTEAVRFTAEQLLEAGTVYASPPRLSRKMRPLSVLRWHAVRGAENGNKHPLVNFAVLLRVGLLGW